MPADEEIRRARDASNQALLSGDLSAFMASIDGDYVGTVGNGGHIRSRGELRKLVTSLFRSADRPYFVRDTEELVVCGDEKRAVEVGRWTGYLRTPDGGTKVTDSGRYTAHWRAAGDRWVIHGELFVTLG